MLGPPTDSWRKLGQQFEIVSRLLSLNLPGWSLVAKKDKLFYLRTNTRVSKPFPCCAWRLQIAHNVKV